MPPDPVGATELDGGALNVAVVDASVIAVPDPDGADHRRWLHGEGELVR